MATSKKTRTVFLTLTLLSLLLLSSFCYATKTKVEEEDEDLSFLEEEDEITSPSPLSDDEAEYYGGGSGEEYEQGWEENDEDEEVEGLEGNGGEHSFPEVDEKDVVVLKESNFSEFVSSNDNKFVMVEFFAPWCGHCQALAPEYAAAATELKGEVVLAKVDATEDANLSQKFEVQGFPTILFFAGGETNPKPYQGARTKDAIVAWAKKKSGPAISNVTAVEVAEQILTANNLLAVAFLDFLVGPESEELVAASRLDDDVSFYQTATEDVAKVFHIDPKAKRPALVLLKKDAEKTTFDGNFSKHEILEFVVANKLPLVINFTRENAPALFESSIKKQVLLFSLSKDYEKVMPLFKDAATSFKGKLLFVHVDLNNEEVGKPVSDYFGVTGDGPSVIGFSGNEDQKKFFLTGEITIEAIKTFAQDFVEEKLKPFYKSEPVPEKNDGDVKIVVGNTFDEIVLDESKDVLLEIYAPWCGHCQTLEPIYNKLGKHLRGIDSLVIAKMDGTANEHSRAQPDGFPTILFFPAGKKSFDPIVVDTDRTVVALYKFIKQNAAILFKLQKPTTETKTSDSTTTPAKEEAVKDETVTDVKEESSKDVKDEL